MADTIVEVNTAANPAYVRIPGGAGGAGTLHDAYAAGVNQADNTINLTAAGGGVRIFDNAAPLAVPLFEIADATGAVRYFSSTPNETVIRTTGATIGTLFNAGSGAIYGGVTSGIFIGAKQGAGLGGEVALHDGDEDSTMLYLYGGAAAGEAAIWWYPALLGVPDVRLKRVAVNTLQLDNAFDASATLMIIGDNLATTTFDGLRLANPTAGTVPVPVQYSPALTFESSFFPGIAVTSKMRLQNRPNLTATSGALYLENELTGVITIPILSIYTDFGTFTNFLQGSLTYLGTSTFAAPTGAFGATMIVSPGDLTGAQQAAIDVDFDLDHIVTFGAGAQGVARAINVAPPTYAATGAATLDTATTVYIGAAPTQGANMTIADRYALEVAAGTSAFYDVVQVTSQVANGGATLQDTPVISLRGAYWNGAASVNYAATIFHDMLSTAPSSALRCLIDGTKAFAVTTTTTVGGLTAQSGTLVAGNLTTWRGGGNSSRIEAWDGTNDAAAIGMFANGAGGAGALQFFPAGTALDVQLFRAAAKTIKIDDGAAGAAWLGWIAATVQTTVGAAGGASALPLTPTKYLQVKDDGGVTLVIPAYAAA